jgi:uncharacterized protein (TIGR00725 family)
VAGHGRRYVAVVGPGEASEAECAMAAEVGRLLAERGAVLVTGGLGGTMAAAAQGCSDAGGTAVALLPGSERADANPYSSIVLPTGLGELRNGLIVRAADAVIAIGGSWGTLSEIALARRTAVPVICLGAWSVTSPSGTDLALLVAGSPAEAVDFALTTSGS